MSDGSEQVDASPSSANKLSTREQLRILLFLLPLFGIFWLAMLLTHESGHAIAGLLTGADITDFQIDPLRLPHTLLSPNPHPSVVLWGGFLSGWFLPALTFPFWKVQRKAIGSIFKLLFSFCLLAGGSYLAAGGGESFSDTGQLLAQGWSHGLLIVSGCVVAVLGYTFGRRNMLAVIDHLKNDLPTSLDTVIVSTILVLWFTIQRAAALWM